MNEAAAVDTRAELIARAQGYQSSEPSFARFLRTVAEATDPADLALHSAEALEATLRKSSGR